jgi:DNA repair exonuclease SbcCD ATPase subunit
MASLQQLNDLKKSIVKQIDKLIASIPPVADAAGDDTEPEPEKEEVKMTPVQKLEKQLEANNEKLTKLSEKIAGGKSKIPDKDEENKTKLEAKIAELEKKISDLADKAKPKPAKAKAEKKVPEKVPEPEKAKKNIPRITPAMTTKLKEAFETVAAAWDDKYKAEFVTQVNSLSEEQYAEFGLEGHMSKFANTHAPAAGGGGGGPGPLNMKPASELKKLHKNLKEVSAGMYQHKTTGEMFVGPAEDPDEEFEDAEVGDVSYIVGQTTKRVYIASDGPDEFVGYWGVGKFYEADL